ncbi:hypothetical protein GEV33_000323 [Tenebrio molitor]|uniref:Uncharacterized protein n=1 Tax=Tenebrio molitor TaxID=7067 RepID=A0A8J6HZR1_TENMO|nr:hypothetical protein GEV33_000323 [Tenebrio molitor]
MAPCEPDGDEFLVTAVVVTVGSASNQKNDHAFEIPVFRNSFVDSPGSIGLRTAVASFIPGSSSQDTATSLPMRLHQKQINYSTGKTLSKSSRLVDLTGEYDLCGLLLPCSSAAQHRPR